MPPVVQKLVSAELQFDHRKDSSSVAAAAALAEQMRTNPLIKYLREKGERKMLEKRAARDKARGLVSAALSGSATKALKVTGVLSKKGGVTRTKVSSRHGYLILVRDVTPVLDVSEEFVLCCSCCSGGGGGGGFSRRKQQHRQRQGQISERETHEEDS